MPKLGYLAPEFPGQTHTFLWREYRALRDLGVDVEIVSTKRPPREIVSHSWAEEAESKTTYLLPLTLKDAVEAAAEIVRSGPRAWGRCARSAVEARSLSWEGRLKLLGAVVVAAKLVGVAKRGGWEHLHVSSCGNAANVALLAKHLSDLPYSLSLLGPTLETYGPNQEQKWRFASFALVMSEKLLADVRNKLAHVLPADVEVAPVGVDTDIVQRNGEYVPWTPGEPCHIYSCGRLNPVKGWTDLIAAVSSLADHGVDRVVLTIAGEDELGGRGYRKTLEAALEAIPPFVEVELLGAVSEERHRKELERAHVFALASLNEGVSVAIMEAMAMRTPVVVTRVGGNTELVEDGVNGILVQPGQPTVFAEALARVLRSPKLALELSERSRQKVLEKFSHRRSAPALARRLSPTRRA